MTSRTIGLITVIAGLLGTAAAPAKAHPHVWISVESTVLYDKGAVTGLRLRWVFDEFYSNMAIDGLDTNSDGIYSRAELAELAKVNIDGLAQMAYYTHAKLAEQRLEFDAPADYLLDHAAVRGPPGPGSLLEPQSQTGESGFWARLVGRLTGSTAEKAVDTKVLALEFTLPLKQPVLAEAEGFEYGVYDPDFWIWFDMAGPRGAQLGPTAPQGCAAVIGLPKKDAAELQQLNEAFFGQMGGSQLGAGVAKSVSVRCPKS